jgi:hypothetical protein
MSSCSKEDMKLVSSSLEIGNGILK